MFFGKREFTHLGFFHLNYICIIGIALINYSKFVINSFAFFKSIPKHSKGIQTGANAITMTMRIKKIDVLPGIVSVCSNYHSPQSSATFSSL